MGRRALLGTFDLPPGCFSMQQDARGPIVQHNASPKPVSASQEKKGSKTEKVMRAAGVQKVDGVLVRDAAAIADGISV